LHSSNTFKKWEYNEAVSQVFTPVKLKKVCDSVRRKVLYCIGQWKLALIG
jgi:hypothetical protein